MPEVIMQYEEYEGKMISLKRREELVRCGECAHYVDSGVKDVRMCEITLRVKSANGYCNESNRSNTNHDD